MEGECVLERISELIASGVGRSPGERVQETQRGALEVGGEKECKVYGDREAPEYDSDMVFLSYKWNLRIQFFLNSMLEEKVKYQIGKTPKDSILVVEWQHAKIKRLTAQLCGALLRDGDVKPPPLDWIQKSWKIA